MCLVASSYIYKTCIIQEACTMSIEQTFTKADRLTCGKFVFLKFCLAVKQKRDGKWLGIDELLLCEDLGCVTESRLAFVVRCLL